MISFDLSSLSVERTDCLSMRKQKCFSLLFEFGFFCVLVQKSLF